MTKWITAALSSSNFSLPNVRSDRVTSISEGIICNFIRRFSFFLTIFLIFRSYLHDDHSWDEAKAGKLFWLNDLACRRGKQGSLKNNINFFAHNLLAITSFISTFFIFHSFPSKEIVMTMKNFSQRTLGCRKPLRRCRKWCNFEKPKDNYAKS